MIAKNSITPNEVKEKYEHYCTVGDLRKFLKEHNLPDSAKVLIQRVEDVYFEKHKWPTVKKEGYLYHSDAMIIEKAKPGGEFHDREKYPNMTDEVIQDILDSEKTLDECKEEYVPAFCPVKYSDDDNLYFDAHY